MSITVPLETDDYLYFDALQCAEAGRKLAEQYQNAGPFPHIMMEEFLPRDFLRSLLPEYPSTDNKTGFNRNQERSKYQFTPGEIPGRRLRNLLMELNSPAMLAFLEEMTGIKHLIPDPYFSGGGLHITKSGGHLSIHADFNVNRKMNVERRLNLLIYMNDDWPEEYGGHLELWDRNMKKCEKRILPTLGRAVVFNTSLDSYHGQPDPVTCPPERSRLSIATYYYTSSEEGIARLPQRTTVFKARAGTNDKPDLRVKFDHFLKDWSPPRLYPFLRKFNRFK